MLRQKFSYRKDIENRKKAKNQRKNREKVCSLTKAIKNFLKKILIHFEVSKKCHVVFKKLFYFFEFF